MCYDREGGGPTIVSTLARGGGYSLALAFSLTPIRFHLCTLSLPLILARVLSRSHKFSFLHSRTPSSLLLAFSPPPPSHPFAFAERTSLRLHLHSPPPVQVLSLPFALSLALTYSHSRLRFLLARSFLFYYLGSGEGI